MIKQIDDKWYKPTLVLIFSFVFIYSIIRTFYTDTLHDEVASYMFYFYHGDYIGDSIHWDANNHFLNSFFGHQLFKIFGDNFGLLRLPNLLSFPLYFWGTYQLTKQLKTPWLKIIGVLVLNTIPFIIEFFSSARGYGLSMGFFLCSLVFFRSYIRDVRIKDLLLFHLCLLLSISANLTLLNSGLILISLTIINVVINVKNKNTPTVKYVYHFLIHGVGIIPLILLILYGILLKEHGALYYGSLEGFWDVTIKSLTQYVLFTESNAIIIIYLGLIFISIIGVYASFKRYRVELITKMYPIILYSVLLIGNVTAIFLLAFLFEINYPEDRTAMYLIPLSLLFIIHVFEEVKLGTYLQFSLLIFPVIFLFKMSVETSVFYPDDRMNSAFYEKVRKQITPENTIMIYPIMNWNWPYLESKQKSQKSVALFSAFNSTLPDILITKTGEIHNPEIYTLYDTIAFHPASTHIAFKRKNFLPRHMLFSKPVQNKNVRDEFIEFGIINIDSIPISNAILTIDGHLKTYTEKDKISLVVSVKNKNGEDTRYLYYSFETVFQSKRIDNNFRHHFLLDNISPDESEIKVYLWNRGLNLCTLTNVSYELFELKEP